MVEKRGQIHYRRRVPESLRGVVGKKEIYIPYNNYKVTSPEVKYKDLLQVGHLNPALTRNGVPLPQVAASPIACPEA